MLSHHVLEVAQLHDEQALIHRSLALSTGCCVAVPVLRNPDLTTGERGVPAMQLLCESLGQELCRVRFSRDLPHFEVALGYTLLEP